MDAAGEASVWLSPTLSYKFVLKDSGDVTQWTTDNVVGLLTPNSVETASIQDGAVTAAKLGSMAVTSGKIFADASIDLNRPVVTNTIRDGAITGAKLNSSVMDNSTIELSSGALRVKDLGVTTAKIADAAVTTAKVADAAIGTTQLSSGVNTVLTGAAAIQRLKNTASTTYSAFVISGGDVSVFTVPAGQFVLLSARSDASAPGQELLINGIVVAPLQTSDTNYLALPGQTVAIRRNAQGTYTLVAHYIATVTGL